jgi:hypothetical protein
MRQRIDLVRLFTQASRAVSETMDGQPPMPLPDLCPVALDELLVGF